MRRSQSHIWGKENKLQQKAKENTKQWQNSKPRTCANLPRAKADISLSWGSGDWSMSIKGRTAPLWTMLTCTTTIQIKGVSQEMKRLDKQKLSKVRKLKWFHQPYSLNQLLQIAPAVKQLLFDFQNSRNFGQNKIGN